MYIEIEKSTDDKLTKYEWSFLFETDNRRGNIPNGLTFYSYTESTRATRRHKNWDTKRYWGLNAPGYGKVEKSIAFPADILTPEIVKEAINMLMEKLTFNLHKHYNYFPTETSKYQSSKDSHKTKIIAPLNTLHRMYPDDFKEAIENGVKDFNDDLATEKRLDRVF